MTEISSKLLMMRDHLLQLERQLDKTIADSFDTDVAKTAAGATGIEAEFARMADAIADLTTRTEGLAALLAHGRLDKTAVDDEPILLELAQRLGQTELMRRLIDFRNANRPTSRPNYWAIVDFNLHSSKRRLFIYDVRGNEVRQYLCAHGDGSDVGSEMGYATHFSNTPGSHASSLGIYRCAETYVGSHGRSMRLDGWQATNSNARPRAIVVHCAWYVSDQKVVEWGRIGRSQGCFVVDERVRDDVIDALRDGSLLIAHHG